MRFYCIVSLLPHISQSFFRISFQYWRLNSLIFLVRILGLLMQYDYSWEMYKAEFIEEEKHLLLCLWTIWIKGKGGNPFFLLLASLLLSYLISMNCSPGYKVRHFYIVILCNVRWTHGTIEWKLKRLRLFENHSSLKVIKYAALYKKCNIFTR